MPYARADERYIQYLENKEKRVGKPRREGSARLLLENALAQEEAKTKGALAQEEVKIKGALEERGMMEAGSDRRLGKEQDFARPLQTAEIGRVGATAGKSRAETAGIKYDTGFKRGSEDILTRILESSAEEAETSASRATLGLGEERRDIKLRDDAEHKAALEAETEPTKVPVPARPEKREMSSSLKRALYGGKTKGGSYRYGYLMPFQELGNLGSWINKSLYKGFEAAFPRGG